MVISFSAARMLMTPRPSGADLQEINDVERGLAEELVGALLLPAPAAGVATRRPLAGATLPYLRPQLGGALAHLVDYAAQILQIAGSTMLGSPAGAPVLGPAEGDVENAFLRLGQLQQAGEQQRPHLLHGGADGRPCSPKMSQNATGKAALP